MAKILEIADRYDGPSLPCKTFAVRSKRMVRRSFKSMDVEQAVGAGLNLKYDNVMVNLKDPEVSAALSVPFLKLKFGFADFDPSNTTCITANRA